MRILPPGPDWVGLPLRPGKDGRWPRMWSARMRGWVVLASWLLHMALPAWWLDMRPPAPLVELAAPAPPVEAASGPAAPAVPPSEIPPSPVPEPPLPRRRHRRPSPPAAPSPRSPSQRRRAQPGHADTKLRRQPSLSLVQPRRTRPPRRRSPSRPHPADLPQILPDYLSLIQIRLTGVKRYTPRRPASTPCKAPCCCTSCSQQTARCCSRASSTAPESHRWTPKEWP